MDEELHNEFEKTKFPDEVVQMFKKILEKDEVHQNVLAFIALKQTEKENVSVLQLIENITTKRRVKISQKKSFHFEVQEAQIDRKSAERIVDKLSSMSLVYYEYMAPYKLLFLTYRGAQVFNALKQNKQLEIGEEN